MLLTDCKKGIEAGHTAKLVQPARFFNITIRIVKRGGFIWQRATIDNPGQKYYARANTAGYPDWDSLLEGIQGDQTTTDDWTLCDEPIEPYN